VGAGIAGLVFRGFATADAPTTSLADAADVDEIDDAERLDDTAAPDAVTPDAVTPGAPRTAAAEVPARRDEAQEFFDGRRG
jgi:aquaporin Z